MTHHEKPGEEMVLLCHIVCICNIQSWLFLLLVTRGGTSAIQQLHEHTALKERDLRCIQAVFQVLFVKKKQGAY